MQVGSIKHVPRVKPFGTVAKNVKKCPRTGLICMAPPAWGHQSIMALRYFAANKIKCQRHRSLAQSAHVMRCLRTLFINEQALLFAYFWFNLLPNIDASGCFLSLAFMFARRDPLYPRLYFRTQGTGPGLIYCGEKQVSYRGHPCCKKKKKKKVSSMRSARY